MTPPTTRSFPFTLQGAPAVIAGAAPEARPPVTSQANEATVAERNARREELFIRQTVAIGASSVSAGSPQYHQAITIDTCPAECQTTGQTP